MLDLLHFSQQTINKKNIL